MPATIEVADGRICARCSRPVHRTESGEWRCPDCRATERSQQRSRASAREDALTRDRGELDAIRRRTDDNEELTEDDARRLIELDGPQAVDCGDNFGMAVRIGAIPVTTEDLIEADRLWATGEAPGILKRAGITTNAFGRMIGCTGRLVAYWNAGDSNPTHSKHRHPAAAALLALKTEIDDSNAILHAHGRPTTIEAQRALEKDHAELWETQRPWDHCDGCAKARRRRNRT
jgi:hypothetical protein